MRHNIYPWQIAQWTHLNDLCVRNIFPHALLLTGARDLGKRAFALALAERLLCGKELCPMPETCASCCLMSSGAHPDFYLIEPFSDTKIIKVEQIRTVVSALAQTSQRGGVQVVLLYPAEAMNIAVANALLKTLEEPHAGIIFLLVSDQSTSIPATVKSRCQNINFPIPDTSVGMSWLKQQAPSTHRLEELLVLAEHIPLRALNLCEGDRLQVHNKIVECFLNVRLSRLALSETVELLRDISLIHIADVCWVLVMDLIRLKHQEVAQTIKYIQYTEKLHQVGERIYVGKLFKFIEIITVFKEKAMSHVALNQQLLLEDLLIRWRKLS